MIKKIFVFIFCSVSMLVMPLFFERSYLSGRWFSKNLTVGWKWCWRSLFFQKILGFNRRIRFPVSHFSTYDGEISFDPDNLDNFQMKGQYFQSNIKIGSGTYIAANIGIITKNHSFDNLAEYSEIKPVSIGKKCWIGMNTVILPGVELGDSTIVGAGSVVTKSFKKGYCVLAGNPAKIIKELSHE